MIERNREAGVFEVSCDKCPDGYETFDVDWDWDAMISELKEAGWKIIFHEGEYEHYCPDCEPPDPVERALKS
ncbi:MAG: hypothetical protein ACR2QF_01295 [Geminicoccaceae bacterium]